MKEEYLKWPWGISDTIENLKETKKNLQIIALNVNADLGYFDNIIPCGIRGKAVTSLNVELGLEEMDMEEVKEKIKKHFTELFESQFVAFKAVTV